MKKICKFSISVFLLTLMVWTQLFLVGCSKRPSNEELRVIHDSIKNRLEMASKKFESEGIEAAAQYCAEDQRVSTSVGTVTVKCTVCADFYNPEGKITATGNNTFLPVSVFANVRDGIKYQKHGYKFRNVTVTVFTNGDYIYVGGGVSQKEYK